jgi:lactoylglutathione lyase
MKLVSCRLLVTDFAKSLAFWRDTVGLALSYSDEALGYAYFDSGGIGLELYVREQFINDLGEVASRPQVHGYQEVITFQVDDVDATFAQLVERGATAVSAPIDRPAWQARAGHISDPDGHLVEIYSKLGEFDLPTA